MTAVMISVLVSLLCIIYGEGKGEMRGSDPSSDSVIKEVADAGRAPSLLTHGSPTPSPSSSPTTTSTRSPSTLNSINTTMDISHLNYGNNENLNWFFQPLNGTLRYLVHFEMSSMESCCDYLSFGPAGQIESSRCRGTSVTCPDVYITSSTGISFTFQSDSSVTSAGFSLSVSVVGDDGPALSSQPTTQPSSHPSTRPSSQPSTQPSSKPSTQPSTEPSSAPTTTSTRSPSTLNDNGNTTNISNLNYGNNERLNWFYQPRNGTLRYLVHFYMSSMENVYDYLSFGSAGQIESSRCTGTSGTCSDVYITSSTGISFTFYSDSSVTSAGFSLSVSVVGDAIPAPSSGPTVRPTFPFALPTAVPTSSPTTVSTATPTSSPTTVPTAVPTSSMTIVPTAVPTMITLSPSLSTTASPTNVPSQRPVVAVRKNFQSSMVITGMMISQATDVFTAAFKASMASTLGISRTNLMAVTYTQTREQYLAGVTVEYVISLSTEIPTTVFVTDLKTALSTGDFGSSLSDTSGITNLGEIQFLYLLEIYY